MNSKLLTQDIDHINQEVSLEALESGSVLFFPEHSFLSVDESLLSETILPPTHKNLSYDYQKKKLGAFNQKIGGLASRLEHLMLGYAEFSYQLVQAALPSYIPHLQWGRTSFRPAHMLYLHDTMKRDDMYQAQVEKTQIDFPGGSTWIVYTDSVSHAALSGQHLLEQTFYLSVDKMDSPELSPFYEWKKYRPEMQLNKINV